MASGPEHYREAERLIAGRMEPSGVELAPHRYVPPTADEIAMAQVHATLALTAANALQGDYEDWTAALAKDGA